MRTSTLYKSVAVILIGFVPWIGVALLALYALRTARTVPFHFGSWRVYLLFAPLLIPLPFQLISGTPPDLLLLGQYVGAIVAFRVLRAIDSLPWHGFLVSLVCLCALAVLERETSRGTWSDPSHPHSITNLWGVGQLDASNLLSGSGGIAFPKNWSNVEPGRSYELSLSARTQDDFSGWEWYQYNGAAISPVPLTDNSVATHIKALSPTNSYVTRDINTGSPIGGRTFRAAVELRSSNGAVDETAGCDGIILQENGGDYSGACSSIQLSPEWKRFDIEFQPDSSVETTGIRLVLQGIPVDFDARGAVVEELVAGTWTEFTAVEPTGVGVRQSLAGQRRHDVFSWRFNPSAEWTSFTVPITARLVDSEGNFSLSLQLEGGSTLSVRNVQLTPVHSATMPPTPDAATRLTFVHPQANLAGHSVAAFTFAALAMVPSPIAAILVGGIGTILVMLTASRTAFVVSLLVSAVVIVYHLFRMSRVSKLSAVAIGALALALVPTAAVLAPQPTVLKRLNPIEPEFIESVSRTDIWEFSLKSMQDNPWLGVHPTPFSGIWSETRPEPVHHAHNFWLEFGVRYGVPGAVAGLLYASFMVAVAVRHGGWLSTTVILGILLMQFTDFTIFYSGVFIPTLIVLAGRVKSSAVRANE